MITLFKKAWSLNWELILHSVGLFYVLVGIIFVLYTYEMEVARTMKRAAKRQQNTTTGVIK